MIKKLTFLLLLFAFAFLAESRAQTPSTTEKQAAIKELLAIFNEDASIEKLMAAFSTQTDEIAKTTIKRMLDEDKTLPSDQRKAVEDLLLNDTTNMFKRYQDKLMSRLNLAQMVEEISTAIYEKHYTLEEIRELTAFYKSPLGRKTLKLTPEIFGESMQILMEKLPPKITEVTKEIEKEMRREFEEKIKTQKSTTKKPVAR